MTYSTSRYYTPEGAIDSARNLEMRGKLVRTPPLGATLTTYRVVNSNSLIAFDDWIVQNVDFATCASLAAEVNQ